MVVKGRLFFLMLVLLCVSCVHSGYRSKNNHSGQSEFSNEALSEHKTTPVKNTSTNELAEHDAQNDTCSFVDLKEYDDEKEEPEAADGIEAFAVDGNILEDSEDFEKCETTVLEEPEELIYWELRDTKGFLKELIHEETLYLTNRKVDIFLKYYQTRGRARFEKWLRRFSRYEQMMRDIFVENGLPEDLIYLSIVESGCNPKAYSRAKAVGVWQFIRGTGKKYGLKINWWYDERRDPVKSTRAAAAYLKDLYNIFGKWDLAIASYNVGERRVLRATRRQKSTNYWSLRLPRETRNYLPAFLAALRIAKNPTHFGFSNEKLTPYEYEGVTIDKCIDLVVAARCCGTTYKKLRELNPELKRRCTPPNVKSYTLKIPSGHAKRFESGYQKLTSREMMRFTKYKVRKGDTLSGIGRRYRVPVSSLISLNKITNVRRIHPGDIIIVPLSYSRGRRFVAQKKPNSKRKSSHKEHRGGQWYAYVVKEGDTLWDIARASDVTVRDVMAWNDLRRSRIYPGNKLWLKKKVNFASRSKAPLSGVDKLSSTVYTVKKGDTLWDIAALHKVKMYDLMRWNNLRYGKHIYPGDKLKIHVGVENL